MVESLARLFTYEISSKNLELATSRSSLECMGSGGFWRRRIWRPATSSKPPATCPRTLSLGSREMHIPLGVSRQELLSIREPFFSYSIIFLDAFFSIEIFKNILHVSYWKWPILEESWLLFFQKFCLWNLYYLEFRNFRVERYPTMDSEVFIRQAGHAATVVKHQGDFTVIRVGFRQFSMHKF